MASLALPTTRPELRRTVKDVVDGYTRHHVLTYASAIAYQVLSALIPFALFALALAGILGHLESLWTDHLRPTVLALATGLTLRVAPARELPARWVSFGSLVIVIGWLVVVGGYVIYATSIASYASVFGSLAALFVLLIAVYLSAAVFLTGALIDDAARRRGS